MYVYNTYDDVKQARPYSVALGSFDGVHLGHQQLIKAMVEKSRVNHTCSLIYTFEEHPRKLLNQRAPLELLTQNDMRLKIFESLGVDTVFLDHFHKIRTLSPEDFVKEILVNIFQIRFATAGYNYHFGRYSAGDAKLLRKLGDRFGFEVKIFQPIKIAQNVVSSTLIRNLIVNGKMEQIKTYLGRNYSIVGEIIPGKQNGQKFGIRTANLILSEDSVVPKEGVYLTNTIIDGKKYKSITNVGDNPTFCADRMTVETHLIDFCKNIYGKRIEVEFLKWTRPEIAFTSADALFCQIASDIQERKNFTK